MNSCTFEGRLGKDAELKQAGKSQICNFSVACNVGFGDKKSTLWIGCNLWGMRGQKLQQYLTKGSHVIVVGELSETEYNGKKYLNLNVDNVSLVGDNQNQSNQNNFQQPAQQQNNFQQPAQQQSSFQQPQQGTGSDFTPFDNNMPF